MCSICGSTPCRSGCPNEGGGERYIECDLCGYEIYSGTEYYRIDEYNVCPHCMEKALRTAEVGYED